MGLREGGRGGGTVRPVLALRAVAMGRGFTHMLSTGSAVLILSLAVLAAVVAWWFAIQSRDAALALRVSRTRIEALAGDVESLSAQLQKLRGRVYRDAAKTVPEPTLPETPQQIRDRLAASHPGVRGQLANPATFQ